jgi:hypothetical protein
MSWFKSNIKRKYKIDMIQDNDTKEIVYGLYEWVNSPACYWNLRFVFASEQSARDFVEKWKEYPKYFDVEV